MEDETIIIPVWADTGANIHSRRDGDFEVGRAEWEAASEDEKAR